MAEVLRFFAEYIHSAKIPCFTRVSTGSHVSAWFFAWRSECPRESRRLPAGITVCSREYRRVTAKGR